MVMTMVMAMVMEVGVIIDDAYESCCEDNDEDKFCHKYFTNEIISFWFAGRQCRSVTYVLCRSFGEVRMSFGKFFPQQCTFPILVTFTSPSKQNCDYSSPSPSL